MRLVRCWVLTFALALVGMGLPGAWGAEPDSVKADEETVRQAGLGTDGPALAQFFRRRTPGEKVWQNIEKLVRDLGAGRFKLREAASRELASIGPPALNPLRAALKSDDVEVVRRAKRCIEEIERSVQPDLIASAARLLAHRRPPRAAELLLGYLPYAPDEYSSEEVRGALVPLAVRDGKADDVVLKALEDKDALKRGAAAEALAHAGGKKERALARALLKDADVEVRLRVALALVERKEKDAAEALVKLLPDVPDEHRWRAEQVLPLLAGDDAPNVYAGNSDREWKEYCKAWAGWWRDQGAKLDLASVDLSRRVRGLTLVVQLDPRGKPGLAGLTGKVFEVGMDGKTRWEVSGLNYPVDAQVTGPNRVLITEYRGKQVSERNFKGDVLWSKQFPRYVMGARRLANGNTLVNLRSQVVEINRKGEQVAHFQAPGSMIVSAGRTRNGQTVLVDYRGLCIYMDESGREVKRFTVGAREIISAIGTPVDILPNGNVVVPQYSQNRVVEFDANGKQVGQVQAQRPTSAMRLPNGHTLVTSRYSRDVEELDRDGKVVWRYQAEIGNVLCVRRR
jgi:hypothetical protein